MNTNPLYKSHPAGNRSIQVTYARRFSTISNEERYQASRAGFGTLFAYRQGIAPPAPPDLTWPYAHAAVQLRDGALDDNSGDVV